MDGLGNDLYRDDTAEEQLDHLIACFFKKQHLHSVCYAMNARQIYSTAVDSMGYLRCNRAILYCNPAKLFRLKIFKFRRKIFATCEISETSGI